MGGMISCPASTDSTNGFLQRFPEEPEEAAQGEQQQGSTVEQRDDSRGEQACWRCWVLSRFSNPSRREESTATASASSAAREHRDASCAAAVEQCDRRIQTDDISHLMGRADVEANSKECQTEELVYSAVRLMENARAKQVREVRTPEVASSGQ